MRWTATFGGGSLGPALSTTDQTGRATSGWTLGAATADTATATVAGNLSATFTARAATRQGAVTWTVEASGTTANLNGVWGTSGSNVFTVGDSGIILHYDGTAWSRIPRLVSNELPLLSAVWGSSTTDVYVGWLPLMHYDGTSWAAVSGVPTSQVATIWGDAVSNVFVGLASDPALWHFNGSAWTPMLLPAYGSQAHPYRCPNIREIAGGAPNDVYLVDGCQGFFHFDGGTWSFVGGAVYPGGPFATAMSGVVGVGVYGSSFCCSVTMPGVFKLSPDGSHTQLPGAVNGSPLFAYAPNDIFIAGQLAQLTGISHYDGSASSPPIDLGTDAIAIFGPSPGDVFVVGYGGFIAHGRR